jgi:metal-responsive CopG/Arc/MetJ family transcriptional regulator
MARTQTLVQLTEPLLRLLDERAAREGVSRSQVIRDAVEAYLADDQEAEISRRITEGYTRIPQRDDTLEAFTNTARRDAWEDLPW